MASWRNLIGNGADHAGKPVILFYNDLFDRPPDTQSLNASVEGCVFTSDRRMLSRAKAVIFHIPSLRKRRFLFKRPGQLWVAWSMESEVNYPDLTDPAFMRRFDLTMTYRQSADIWTPYLPGRSAFESALSSPLPPKTADAPVVMFQSASIDRSGRNLLALDLMKHIPVHSYGRLLKNRELPGEDRGVETKLAVIGGYKFCIGFENSIGTDYVTEKFFHPLLVGSVPVYLGAPNVDDYAPGEHTFINASNFSSGRELAEYLAHLDANDEAYGRYFQWRERGLSAAFEKLLSAASREPFEQLAEIVAARAGRRA